MMNELDPSSIAEEMDNAWIDGVSEIFRREILSDICHDEVLIQCIKDIDLGIDGTINALVFLSKFFETCKKLADFYGRFDEYPNLKAKAEHFANMTPYSMANRTQRRVAEFRRAGAVSLFVQEAEFVHGVAQEASKLFKKV